MIIYMNLIMNNCIFALFHINKILPIFIKLNLMQHMYACKNIKLIYFLFYFSRLADWLIAIGQNDILLKPNYYTYTYNNGRLCEKHFFDWCFTSTERKTLIKFARPQTECNPNAKGINKHLTAVIGTEVSSSDDSERSQ